MALLYQSMYRAVDDNGDPMPFAELYTRDPVATTTPKATYSDPDLDVSHLNTNPLIADAAGYFGPMYAGSDQQFYLILTEADGDPTAPYKVFADVTALGGDSADSFERTFASARLKITSGEVDTGISGILIQTGPSSPDDTGGAVRMGGQDGTQGDLAIFDYAEIEANGDMSIEGDLSLSGSFTTTGVTGFVQLVSNGACTAAASQVIALPSGYDRYKLVLADFNCSAASLLSAVFSFDGGGSYKTGAGDYDGELVYATASAIASSANAANIGLSGSNVAKYGHYELAIFSDTTTETQVAGQGSYILVADGSSRILFLSGSTDAKSYGKATHVKLQIASGNMNFRYALFGVPGLN